MSARLKLSRRRCDASPTPRPGITSRTAGNSQAAAAASAPAIVPPKAPAAPVLLRRRRRGLPRVEGVLYLPRRERRRRGPAHVGPCRMHLPSAIDREAVVIADERGAGDASGRAGEEEQRVVGTRNGAAHDKRHARAPANRDVQVAKAV